MDIKKYLFSFIIFLFSLNFQGQTIVLNIQHQKAKTEKKFSNIFEDETKLFDLFWWLIISFEKYEPKAYPDHGRFSRGFGTHAEYEGQPITLKDAVEVSKRAYKKRIAWVKETFPNLSLYQTYLIAAFEYNVCRDRWGAIYGKILTGNNELIITSLVKYTQASGETLEGLVIRRQIEAKYLVLEGNYEAIKELHQQTINRFINKNGKEIFGKVDEMG